MERDGNTGAESVLRQETGRSDVIRRGDKVSYCNGVERSEGIDLYGDTC